MGHETYVEVEHVKWFAGYGPRDPIGPCPHVRCHHNATSVIAWGPSLRHYELVQCDDEGCAGRCRAWEAATPTSRGGIPNSHPWLQVTPVDGVRPPPLDDPDGGRRGD